ncbi:hypothetical protein IQ268_20195 [Oculatella sp. LEGE 06141]|uniref:hypothetical protein n=1 Tax=Oculatella sp. LEGE 06141 TaxID=1828648 RepID=UPI001882114F|nr:hypothetical protein [Oculatella sp. LEGE 06141]MBE9180884.1 hypothetical protein [Oculatella sp. LEGE 06141]
MSPEPPPKSPNSGFDVSAQPNGDFETELARKSPNLGGFRGQMQYIYYFSNILLQKPIA